MTPPALYFMIHRVMTQYYSGGESDSTFTKSQNVIAFKGDLPSLNAQQNIFTFEVDLTDTFDGKMVGVKQSSGYTSYPSIEINGVIKTPGSIYNQPWFIHLTSEDIVSQLGLDKLIINTDVIPSLLLPTASIMARGGGWAPNFSNCAEQSGPTNWTTYQANLVDNNLN